MKVEKIKYWQEIAFDDLDTAKILLKKKKFLQCGFYCHQSVEKILIGYYWFKKGEEAPYTHNLLMLSKKSGIELLYNEYQKSIIDLIAPLNIEARYPDAKLKIYKTLTKKKTKNIFTETEKLVEWIHELMK
jgi:HEPN domain-containing protein